MKQIIACLIMACLPITSMAQSGIGQQNQEATVNLDSLFNAAIALYDEGAYEDALKLAKANTIQAEKQVGKAHEQYAHSLVTLGVIYQELGEYEEAELLFKEALAVVEHVLGEGHISYSVTLGDLASLYHDMSRFEEAEKLFEEVKANIERLGQTISEDYATNVNNYGIMLQELGQYEKAEKEFEIVRGIYEQLYGRKSQPYGIWLNNMGLMLTNLGQFEKAEACFKEAIEINNVVLKDHPDRAYSFNNLAGVYFYQSRYEEALPLFSEARDIRKAHYGENHPKYASSLEYLATVHHSLGNYREAEALMLESKQIKANMLGEDHPSYATTLSNLSIFYQRIGDYEKAEQCLSQAMDIRKAKIGTDHPDYAFALNNMAALCQETGRYKDAAGYLSAAIPVWENVYGKEHPSYARSVNNLGRLYASLKEYEKAEPYYLEALSIWEKNFGKSHAEYIACLADLACMHQETEQFREATDEFAEAENLMVALFGKEHPDYEGLLNRKGQFEYLAGRPAQALASLQKASSIRKKLLARAAQHLSEQELNGYIRKFKDASDMLFSFTADAGADYPQTVASSFDGLLFYKGFLLEGARSLPKAVYTSGDEALAKTYEQWKALQRQLGKLYSLPEEERSGLSAVAGEAEELEKALASRVAGFRESQRQVDWRDVQSQLRPGEAAIEFAQFRYFNKSDWADSTLYCAYILQPGYDAPRLAYLFEERELKKLFESIPERKRESLDNLYAFRGLTPEDSRASSGEDLLRMVWLPFDSLLRGVKRVYLSPSGLLNRVNFAALPFSEKEMLGSRYEIHLLGSTRQLVFRKEASAPPVKSALLLGGIRYDRDTASALAGNEKLVEEEEAIFVPEGPAFVSRSEGSGFGYLPGTLQEARDIGKILANEGFNVKLLEGYQGTEEVFKQTGRTAPSSRILHIATHGYFFPDPVLAPPTPPEGGERTANPPPSGGLGGAFQRSTHPMIRSGLLLAGANPAWRGEPTPPGREDGILTAYEISQMDLSGTELVVLSACETGLGDIEGNEGVYGLQRAFKIAGAKYLIMSLWSVADEETAEFMSTFYREWLSGKRIHAAFRDTQQSMRAWYPEAPYLWAAFILVE